MQSSKKKSVSVKDKLDGNEIDLSLLELTEVPVRELAAVPRGTNLDLSNNKLVTLTVAFPTLTHLVKLDLSKNQLKELPVNFGDLKNLKHLDLYSNELQRLPVSFCQLRELRWLDLKNNPLVSTLAEAAGDCLDQKGCQEAAKKVVKLMTIVHEELEKKRLKQQEEAKAQQLAEKEEEERAKEKARMEKKAEKERRKAEALSKQQQQQKAQSKPAESKAGEGNNVEKKTQKQTKRQNAAKPAAQRSLLGKLFGLLFRLVILVALVAAAIYVVNWEGPLTMENAGAVARRTVDRVSRYSSETCEWASPLLRRCGENIRELALIAWQRTLHYAQVAKGQAVTTLWPAVKQRAAEVSDLAVHYWRLVSKQMPVYLDAVVDKFNRLYHGARD